MQKVTSDMNNREFAKKLEQRTKRFAVCILKLSASLPNTPEGLVVRNQITKSGTSIGANYREANRSRSKADFKNRIRICESEASETQYWLDLVVEAGLLTRGKAQLDCQECSELLAIFTSIAKSA
jgi:four helix bundle protein